MVLLAFSRKLVASSGEKTSYQTKIQLSFWVRNIIIMNKPCQLSEMLFIKEAVAQVFKETGTVLPGGWNLKGHRLFLS